MYFLYLNNFSYSRSNELSNLSRKILKQVFHHGMFILFKDKREFKPTGCEDYDRVCRERAVLTRQLQEAKMALADVKTSWSGQIAALETQVIKIFNM